VGWLDRFILLQHHCLPLPLLAHSERSCPLRDYFACCRRGATYEQSTILILISIYYFCNHPILIPTHISIALLHVKHITGCTSIYCRWEKDHLYASFCVCPWIFFECVGRLGDIVTGSIHNAERFDPLRHIVHEEICWGWRSIETWSDWLLCLRLKRELCYRSFQSCWCARSQVRELFIRRNVDVLIWYAGGS